MFLFSAKSSANVCSVAAIVLAATAPAVAGEVFQIASSSETTIEELATKLAAVLKSRGIASPAIRFAEPRIGDVKRNYSDTSKARKLLGWSPRTLLADGLDETVEWFLHARESCKDKR